MPQKCCVPNCRGNYDRDGPKVSVFSFPKDEEIRKVWLERIPRKNFEPSKFSVVCQLHFHKDDLELVSEVWNSKTGECITSPLNRPRLRKGSLPCIFEGFPNRTQKYVKKTRMISTEEKEKEMETARKMAELRKQREKQKEKERRFEEIEKLKSLDDLEEKLEDFVVKENVRIERRTNKMFIYRLETEPRLRVKYSIEIDETLKMDVYQENMRLPLMKLNNVKLIFPVLTPTLSVVQAIVKKMNLMVETNYAPMVDVKKESLSIIKSHLEFFRTESNKDHIQFILQQIDCISRSNSCYYRWSSDIITFLGFFMALFPRAYYFLMRSQRITLPSPGIVKELSHEKFAYISKVKRHAKDDDNNVILVINEVDVRPFSGVFKKKGYSTACVYVFSVSSLITSFKEVVYVTPVQTDYTPAKLHATLLKLIAELEKFKFQVVGLVSDNLPFNVDAVSRLADPPKLSIAYMHPCDAKRPLFYVIDAAHTFKCVRDDWLLTPEGIMKFPSFHVPNKDNLLTAKFSDLKRLMEPPPENVTFTHSITKLALNPVFPHKRDLKLVLQLFSEAVVTDLTVLSQESGKTSETAQFVNILKNWWKVAGFDSLDESSYNGLSQPLSLASESYQFLENMLEWLERWGEIIEKERSAVRAELEAQLAEKQAKQAERAAKAVLAELSGAKKRKRKRPKKSTDKDEGNEAPVLTEETPQSSEEPDSEVRIPEPEPYQPNGNVNWVEQNVDVICGHTYAIPNGYQHVYNYQHDPIFGTVHSSYELNQATGQNYYQAPHQYYPHCSQNYGSSQSGQQNRSQQCDQLAIDEEAVAKVSVVLPEGEEHRKPEKTQQPELITSPKKKSRTPRKRKSGDEGSRPVDSSGDPLETSAPPPAEPPPVIVPKFAGSSKGGVRCLRFNFVKFETFTALKHSTYALLEITKYCVKELKMKHILQGKVHVDGLQMICVDSTFTPCSEKED